MFNVELDESRVLGTNATLALNPNSKFKIQHSKSLSIPPGTGPP
jgi:hypothetical protein